MKISKEKIRTAVLANRGLPADIKDHQIRIIWNSLDDATREKYLKSVEPEVSQKSEVKKK